MAETTSFESEKSDFEDFEPTMESNPGRSHLEVQNDDVGKII
jgi:hypothetical protein